MIQSTVNHKRMLEMSSADTLSVDVCMCGIRIHLNANVRALSVLKGRGNSGPYLR